MTSLRVATLVLVMAACFVVTATARAQCTRCCPFGLQPNVKVSPKRVVPGQPVVVTTTLYNCNTFPRVFTARVNVLPRAACAPFAEAFSISALVGPVQERTVSYTFAAPNCRGTYKVRETANDVIGIAKAKLFVK